MRAYVLVEGRRTEPKVYRRWLPALFPGHEEVARVEDMADDRFYLVSGGGYPSYLKRLADAVTDVNRVPGRFDVLLVCVDTEEDCGHAEKTRQVEDAIAAEGCSVRAVPVVAHCCIETWFLGNRRFVRPGGEALAPFLAHHDVRTLDPEALPALGDRGRVRTAFDYLRAACAAHQRMGSSGHPAYSKFDPGPVRDPAYLKELVRRADDTPHLPSFRAALAALRELGAVL